MRSALLADGGAAAGAQISPLGLGILTFCVFLALLLVTMAFKSVGKRRRHK